MTAAALAGGSHGGCRERGAGPGAVPVQSCVTHSVFSPAGVRGAGCGAGRGLDGRGGAERAAAGCQAVGGAGAGAANGGGRAAGEGDRGAGVGARRRARRGGAAALAGRLPNAQSCSLPGSSCGCSCGGRGVTGTVCSGQAEESRARRQLQLEQEERQAAELARLNREKLKDERIRQQIRQNR